MIEQVSKNGSRKSEQTTNYQKFDYENKYHNENYMHSDDLSDYIGSEKYDKVISTDLSYKHSNIINRDYESARVPENTNNQGQFNKQSTIVSSKVNAESNCVQSMNTEDLGLFNTLHTQMSLNLTPDVSKSKYKSSFVIYPEYSNEIAKQFKNYDTIENRKNSNSSEFSFQNNLDMIQDEQDYNQRQILKGQGNVNGQKQRSYTETEDSIIRIQDEDEYQQDIQNNEITTDRLMTMLQQQEQLILLQKHKLLTSTQLSIDLKHQDTQRELKDAENKLNFMKQQIYGQKIKEQQDQVILFNDQLDVGANPLSQFVKKPPSKVQSNTQKSNNSSSESLKNDKYYCYEDPNLQKNKPHHNLQVQSLFSLQISGTKEKPQVNKYNQKANTTNSKNEELNTNTIINQRTNSL